MTATNIVNVLDSMEVHADGVADSCSEGEESDLDLPRAIARAPAEPHATVSVKAEPLQPLPTNGSSAGPSRTPYVASSSKGTPNKSSAGPKEGVETHYYMVQWSAECSIDRLGRHS